MTEYLRFPDSVKYLFTQVGHLQDKSVFVKGHPGSSMKCIMESHVFMFGFVPSVFDTFFKEPALFLGAGLVFWSSELVLLFGFAFVRGAGLVVWRCLVFCLELASS
jgi:hypothetical protein